MIMLLSDVLEEFLLDCQLRQLSDRTIKHERNSNKKMITFLESEYRVTSLENVKPIHLKGYVLYLTNLGRKETYVNGLIKSFRAFFKYCVKEEYIKDNPALKLNFQKEEVSMILTFTDEEIVKMVKYYNGKSFLQVRNRLIITMLLDTGIRNSELCGIQMKDIRGNVINICGKGKKQRYVPITPAIQKYLMKYLRVRNAYVKDKFRYEVDFLFLSQKGKHLTKETVERVVRDCKEPCGIREEIRCSPHTCRHYYAQKQLLNDCDMYTVSRLLGHKNLSITRRYLQSLKDENIVEMAAKTSPLISLGIK